MLIIVIVIIIAFALIIHGIMAGIGNSHGYSNLNQTDFVDDDGTPMHRVYTDPDSTNRSGIAYSGDLRYIDASVYHPELYNDLWHQIVNKAELTVGTPENLNREKNTCTFTSLTDGSVYSTSLEKCTCPAFGGKEPCKHMVKLAMFLGYYHPQPR